MIPINSKIGKTKWEEAQEFGIGRRRLSPP